MSSDAAILGRGETPTRVALNAICAQISFVLIPALDRRDP